VVVFTDGDVRASAGYVSTVVASLADPAVGLVTCLYADRQPRTLSEAVASLGRCIDFIPGLLMARALDGGLRFALGLTLATRKATLAEAGGLYLDRIGSDYNLGKRVAMAGYRVELASEVLDWATTGETPLDLCRREIRWSRSIRYNRGAQYYAMAFCHGTVYCLLLLLLSGGAGWSIWFSAVTFAVRYLQALICIRATDCARLLPWLWAIPLRDILSLVVWLIGGVGRRVHWRGRVLVIQGDGLISEEAGVSTRPRVAAEAAAAGPAIGDLMRNAFSSPQTTEWIAAKAPVRDRRPSAGARSTPPDSPAAPH